MSLSEHVYCVPVTFKMTEQVEERICIKIGVKLEHSSVETTRMIQKDFRDNAMSTVQIKVWHKPWLVWLSALSTGLQTKSVAQMLPGW